MGSILQTSTQNTHKQDEAEAERSSSLLLLFTQLWSRGEREEGDACLVCS